MMEYEQKEIAFLGKITAACTHEMKNVLAIIKESAGLMEDLMAMTPDAPATLRERLQKSLAIVMAQIKRGSAISDNLNRFAHSTDIPLARIDLATACAHIVDLAQRFARNKKVVLELVPPASPMTITTRPVRLLMTLFGCIECFLNVLPPSSRVVVGAQKKNGDFEVSFTCKGDFSCLPDLSQTIITDSRWPDLKHLAASLGGVLTLAAAAPIIQLSLTETAP
jgi:C4-dicarboxylate-specific signal transduction histidine kinase